MRAHAAAVASAFRRSAHLEGSVSLILPLLSPLLAGAAEEAAVRDSPQLPPFPGPPVTVCLGDEDMAQAAGRGPFWDANVSQSGSVRGFIFVFLFCFGGFLTHI